MHFVFERFVRKFYSLRPNFNIFCFPGIVGTMHTLDVTDTVKMKEVLFGGEPWILYCSDKPGEVSSELNEVIISFDQHFQN